MADILPIENVLQTIHEGKNFSFSFDFELSENETLKKISIKYSDMPEQIIIDENTFKGNFSGLFELPDGSLKYRFNDELFETNSFSKLPPKGSADLYSYSAPQQMLKTFNILVEMEYTSNTPSIDGSETLTEEVLNISKWYKQPVNGNWSTFMNMFLNYVR